MKKYIFIFLLIMISPVMFTSCDKDWLNEKPNLTIVVPSTLEDFQSLLDYIDVLNTSPGLLESGSDDHFISLTRLNATNVLVNESYSWAPNGWTSSNITGWATPYQAIYQTNLVLDKIGDIKKNSSNAIQWENIHSSALFLRAYSYFNLALLFTKSYNSVSAELDLGVPMMLEANISQRLGRSTLKQVLEQIVNDVNNAVSGLPSDVKFKNRPTKAAAFAFLSRVYLYMGNYNEALSYANQCLAINSKLIDYNTLTVYTQANQISFSTAFNTNEEILFYAQLENATDLTQANADVSADIYNSYASNDLRKAIFFRNSSGRIVWGGNYRGTATLQFSGLATDEVMLTRAECFARTGDPTSALTDLNNLLRKRWKTGTYTDYSGISGKTLVDLILTERRKELLYRGIRWGDLKRFNRENDYQKTYSRILPTGTISLVPNDNKYAWPIPNSEILYNDIQQNPR